MTQTKFFTYLGENGTITSPIFLPGIYSICKIQIVADEGYLLTDGKKNVKATVVPESELNNWREIPESAK